MKVTKHTIADVQPGSIADEAGIEAGDSLNAINGRIVLDVLDYLDWTTQDEVRVNIEKKDGQEWVLDIVKAPDEDLGIIFDEPLMDKQRSCRNKCIFCFVDQLPKDMRSTLYEKDDDWRLSFLMGNYITLTNLTAQDIDRIIAKHINPLYISVHTTNPNLRQRMMRNRRAGDILDILKKFSTAHILTHCQIVLCRGWNDGQELERTIEDLWNVRNSVGSMAVVPVGLTKHRQGLPNILPFDKKSAINVLDRVEMWQQKCRQAGGTAFVFAADEFYILAGKQIPSYEHYENFPQIENGVGLIAKFTEEFNHAMKNYCGPYWTQRMVSVATGLSAYPIIQRMMGKMQKITGVNARVYPITNRFFGEKVTVAGLVTGQDIYCQLKGKELGECLLIPSTMLRAGEEVFLDDISLAKLSQLLTVPVISVPVNGSAFFKAVLGLDKTAVKG